MNRYTVTFLPVGKSVCVAEGTDLLQAQIAAGLRPDAPCGGKAACKDNDGTDQHVGLKVFLKVTEELRTCNETYGGYEEDQTQAFDEGKGFFKIEGLGRAAEDQSYVGHAEEQRAEQQSDDENACITQGDALDGNSAQGVA